jgi:hypothetical protein
MVDATCGPCDQIYPGVINTGAFKPGQGEVVENGGLPKVPGDLRVARPSRARC